MLLVTIVNRLGFSRDTGNLVIPVFVWVIMFGLLAVAITTFIVIVAFEVTFQSMLSIGLDSLVVLITGLTVSCIAWFILRETDPLRKLYRTSLARLEVCRLALKCKTNQFLSWGDGCRGVDKRNC